MYKIVSFENIRMVVLYKTLRLCPLWITCGYPVDNFILYGDILVRCIVVGVVGRCYLQ